MRRAVALPGSWSLLGVPLKDVLDWQLVKQGQAAEVKTWPPEPSLAAWHPSDPWVDDLGGLQ